MATLLGQLQDLEKQVPDLPDDVKALLADAKGDIHSALQGEEAKGISKNLLKVIEGLDEQVIQYETAIQEIDIEEQQDEYLLQQAEQDLQLALRESAKDSELFKKLQAEAAVLNPIHAEAISKVAYAEDAVKLSEELANSSRDLLNRILKQRKEERKVRRKSFVNEIFELVLTQLQIAAIVLTVLSFIFPPLAAIVVTLQLIIQGMTLAVQAAQALYNGNWTAFRDSTFKSGGIKLVLKVAAVATGLPPEYIDAAESAYKAYEAYESGEKLSALGHAISAITSAVGELDTGSDGLDLGIDPNWRDAGLKAYNAYEAYSSGNEAQALAKLIGALSSAGKGAGFEGLESEDLSDITDIAVIADYAYDAYEAYESGDSNLALAYAIEGIGKLAAFRIKKSQNHQTNDPQDKEFSFASIGKLATTLAQEAVNIHQGVQAAEDDEWVAVFSSFAEVAKSVYKNFEHEIKNALSSDDEEEQNSTDSGQTDDEGKDSPPNESNGKTNNDSQEGSSSQPQEYDPSIQKFVDQGYPPEQLSVRNGQVVFTFTDYASGLDKEVILGQKEVILGQEVQTIQKFVNQGYPREQLSVRNGQVVFTFTDDVSFLEKEVILGQEVQTIQKFVDQGYPREQLSVRNGQVVFTFTDDVSFLEKEVILGQELHIPDVIKAIKELEEKQKVIKFIKKLELEQLEKGEPDMVEIANEARSYTKKEYNDWRWAVITHHYETFKGSELDTEIYLSGQRVDFGHMIASLSDQLHEIYLDLDIIKVNLDILDIIEASGSSYAGDLGSVVEQFEDNPQGKDITHWFKQLASDEDLAADISAFIIADDIKSGNSKSISEAIVKYDSIPYDKHIKTFLTKSLGAKISDNKVLNKADVVGEVKDEVEDFLRLKGRFYNLFYQSEDSTNNVSEIFYKYLEEKGGLTPQNQPQKNHDKDNNHRPNLMWANGIRP
jgi:uncharacterized cupredoxin-like copper-binding protein